MPGSEPAGTSTKSPGNGGGAGLEGPRELADLVIAYGQQELVGPVRRQLKSLGRGIGGAFLVALGTVLLAIGFLRALQVEFAGSGKVPAKIMYGSGSHLSGNWSWVPYMGGALFCVLVAVFCISRVAGRGK